MPTRAELYKAYLQSDHWRRLRARAIRAHGCHCHACGEQYQIDVHHLSYAEDWHLVTTDDLIPLCHFHHEKLHEEPLLRPIHASRVISSSIKRKIVIHYLRTRLVIDASSAETRTILPSPPVGSPPPGIRTMQKTSRGWKKTGRRRLSNADAQQKRLNALARSSRRNRQRDSFGW